MNKKLLAIPICIAIFVSVILVLKTEREASEAAAWEESKKQAEIERQQKAYAIEQDVFKLTNEVRIENGVTEVTWNDQLAELARDYANKLAAKEVDGHSQESYYLQVPVCTEHAGENLIIGATPDYDAVDLVQGWLDSPSHHNNLLQWQWRFVGIGYTTNDIGWRYVVQAFCT